jgi:hypothetical protein
MVGSKARRRRSACEALGERRWREGSEDERGGDGCGVAPFYRVGEAASQRGNGRRAVEFYSVSF